jgi:hypothetical protein
MSVDFSVPAKIQGKRNIEMRSQFQSTLVKAV